MFKMMDRVSMLIFWLFMGLMGIVCLLEILVILPAYSTKIIARQQATFLKIAAKLETEMGQMAMETAPMGLSTKAEEVLESLRLAWHLKGAELYSAQGDLVYRYPEGFASSSLVGLSARPEPEGLRNIRTPQMIDRDPLDVFDHRVLLFGVPFLKGQQTEGVLFLYKDVEDAIFGSRNLVFLMAGLPFCVMLIMLVVVSMFMTALNEAVVAQDLVAKDLQESRRRLATLLGNIPGMAYRCRNDQDWTMEMISEGGRALMARPIEEVLGNCSISFADIIHPEDRGQVWDQVQQALSTGRAYELEYRIVHQDGSIHWCWGQGCGVYDDQGRLEALEGLIVDITDRKEISSQLDETLQRAINLTFELKDKNAEIEKQHMKLEKAYAELKSTQSQILQQEKMASIGQLAAGVAHEINNPIGFVSSNLNSLSKYIKRFSEFIQSQDELLISARDLLGQQNWEQLLKLRKSLKVDHLLQDGQDLIAESLEGTERVRGIVQGLKNFSRVDQAEHQEADLNECLDSTIRIAWNEIKYKAELVRDFGILPKTLCYPQQLNQVFLNILVNAAHAIEKEGRIDVKTWAEGGEIFIAIADNGCGIPEANLSRLFEPFFTTKEVGKGTGLGLSIAYDIMKKHEGSIQVQSRVGEGTIFTLRLPIRSVAERGGISS